MASRASLCPCTAISRRYCPTGTWGPHQTRGAAMGPRARCSDSPSERSWRSVPDSASNSRPTGSPADVRPAGSTRLAMLAQLASDTLRPIVTSFGTTWPRTVMLPSSPILCAGSIAGGNARATIPCLAKCARIASPIFLRYTMKTS